MGASKSGKSPNSMLPIFANPKFQAAKLHNFLIIGLKMETIAFRLLI
jgi:hypothetical protein